MSIVLAMNVAWRGRLHCSYKSQKVSALLWIELCSKKVRSSLTRKMSVEPSLSAEEGGTFESDTTDQRFGGSGYPNVV